MFDCRKSRSCDEDGGGLVGSLNLCTFCCESVEEDDDPGGWKGDDVIEKFIKFLKELGGTGIAEGGGEEDNERMDCCKTCSVTVNSLSSIYHQLKCLELRLASELEGLVKGMRSASGRMTQIKGRIEKDEVAKRKLKRVESFRMGVINKCSQKLSKCQGIALVEKVGQDDWGSRDFNDEDGAGRIEEENDTTEDPRFSVVESLKQEVIGTDGPPVNSDDDHFNFDDFDNMSLSNATVEVSGSDSHSHPTVEPEGTSQIKLADLQVTSENQHAKKSVNCRPESRSKITMKRHISKKHSTVPVSPSIKSKSQLQCAVCNTCFTAPSSLRRHKYLNRCKGTSAAQPANVTPKVPQKTPETTKPSESKRYNLREKGKRSYRKMDSDESEDNNNDLDPGDDNANEDSQSGGESEPDIPAVNEWHPKSLDSQGKDGKERKCPECHNLFYRPSKLKKHMQRVHPNVPFRLESPPPRLVFRCEVENCRKSYTSKENLERHKTRHFDQNQTKKCPECDKEVKAKYLNRHLRQCHGTSDESHACTVCGKGFRRKTHLNEHILVHQDPESWRFQCTVCGRKCTTKSKLNRHMQMHSSEKAFVCQFCGRRYSYKNKLILHMKLKHKTGQDSKLSSDGNERPHLCPDCGSSFELKRSLNEHILIHKGPDAWKFQCFKCGRMFRTKSKLNRHMWTHVNRKMGPVSCKRCGVKCDQQEDLDNHVKSEHNSDDITAAPKTKKRKPIPEDIDPITCPECGMTFKEKRYLRDHLLIHKGPQSWKHICPVCERKCKTKSNLNRHMKSHGNVEGGIECQFCGVSCARKETLMMHVGRIHPEEYEKIRESSVEEVDNPVNKDDEEINIFENDTFGDVDPL